MELQQIAVIVIGGIVLSALCGGPIMAIVGWLVIRRERRRPVIPASTPKGAEQCPKG